MLYHQDIKRPQGEQLNETKWKKVDKDDQQYVLDAFQDLSIEDAVYEEEEGEPEDDGQTNEHYDSDAEGCGLQGGGEGGGRRT